MTEYKGGPPFGAMRPSPVRRAAQAMAQRLARQDFVGHQLQTTLFKIAGGKKRGAAYDVAVFETERARLHPTGNVCEKRCFSAAQFWDAEERGFLADALFAGGEHEPLFIDVGANVGLYGLAMQAEARRRGRRLRILAVEPDPMLRARLSFNYQASNVPNYEVAAVAVTTSDGPVILTIDGENRGRNSINGCGQAVEVEGRTLPSLIRERNITRVDAMKIDIEGHEIEALSPLFKASRSLWPKAICVEIEGHGNACAAKFCLDHGYELIGETKMNALLRLDG